VTDASHAHAKPEVARKLYPAIRRVFEVARIRLRDGHGIDMPSNPARWDDLKAMGFARPGELRGRHPSLPYAEVPPFMAALKTVDTVAARALEFLILTNVRTDAVLKAAWDEIDVEQALWTVPLENLKDRARREEGFRIPLSQRAVEIVLQKQDARVSRYVFQGRSGVHQSSPVMLRLLKRIGKPITAHGFRATFRTWAEEAATFPHAVVEEAMGHQVGSKVERAYRRTDVLDQRRRLMEAWCAFCSTEVSK